MSYHPDDYAKASTGSQLSRATPNQYPDAPEIREASLRNKADEANGYLTHAHGLLSELESAILGPQISEVGATRGQDHPMPGHPGLRSVLDEASGSGAALVSRLSSLLGRL